MPAYRSAVVRPARTVSPRTWALAAAAAIVAIGGWAASTRSGNEDVSPVASVAPASAPSMVAAESAPAVIPATSPNQVKTPAKTNEVTVASLSLVGSTDDLSDADLENLVSALDGIDAMPAAEPGSVTTTVEDIEGDDGQ